MTEKHEEELKRQAINLLTLMGKSEPKGLPWLIETLNKMASGADKLEATNQQLTALAADHAKLVQAVAELKALTTVGDKLEALSGHHERLTKAIEEIGGRIVPAPPAIDDRPPTYKRALRKGESIQILALRSIRDQSVVQARRQFIRSYLHDLLVAPAAAGAAAAPPRHLVMAGLPAWPQVNGADVPEAQLTDLQIKTLADGLALVVEAIPRGKDAYNAVVAALLDRTGLDQTTRLLLTTPGVLEGEFLRIHQAGQPRARETLAVVEAILRELKQTAKRYFEKLVALHGKQRGWDANAIDTVVASLVTRYAPEARV